MMRKLFKKSLFILPVLLLASCNFKYTYNIAGLPNDGGDMFDDDVEDSGTYDIKVWVTDKIVSLTKSQIGQFVASSGGKYTLNVTVEPVGEDKAAAQMLLDVQSGADLFCFAQDQLSRLKVAGSLAKLSDKYVDALTEEMGQEAVNAAKVNSDVYAFPITSDNGYFLYYDKTVVSEEARKDVSSILAACKTAGKTFNFAAKANGFYAPAYFMATGCHSNWTLNSETGKFESYDDNYNSDKGLIAAKALRELDDSKTVTNDTQASKLGTSAGAVISGIWEYEVAEKNLGENLGCAELPSFTVDGTSYHLSSFDGYKLLGVKPQVDAKKASVCRKLAKFLTSEDCQSERFDLVKWGPTNIASSEKPEVADHIGLKALKDQHQYAFPQGQCPSGWYNSLAATATTIKAGLDESALQGLLASYEASLAELLDD